MPKRKKPITSNSIPKTILFFFSVLQKISTVLTVKFASLLFKSPIKYKIPKREYLMDQKSKQQLVYIPKIKKQIMTYEYGEGSKKILLVHGWSGRGTQLVKIADKLLELGYSTISFDAPAHGKSTGSSTLMPEFIESILELEKIYGPFEYAIGHSLGSMSILNAIKEGLPIKKAVIIGSGDSVNDILLDFVSNLKLKSNIASKIRAHFEKKYQINMESYSAYIAAKSCNIPILVIHDKNDEDVPYTASENIHKNLKNSTLLLTEKLGHRKILGNEKVIEAISHFLEY
ncbi:alpha/beta fold hydrolase [Flavobacterium sp. TP390]|uniref:Alpha/beta fold hydrolase n=1 Tax=Flavobacterium profundi TaxID=1774945 RepID=A0A6I4IEB0_9FLAO|nr:alpha/beta hydrolase [Flavobacterium profundi]MVO07898.1 alpha/beta fold hydrolase [Flavobacterium profundi]